jgi:RNA polymerase sigma-70 factor (ECF subfamily)
MNFASEAAFVTSVQPLRSELRAHCYRMLGSSHDSDDMVQETLLRAWRARGELQDGAAIRPWLYRIASNVCVDELRTRSRRALAPYADEPSARPSAPIAAPSEEATWLEPIPDAWLAGCSEHNPGARLSLKESVSLAFLAAAQWLTPSQRATLLLRDVVGLSAADTAQALGLSVSAANAALFRARRVVEERLPAPTGDQASAGAPDDFAIAQYVRAFEQRDVDALVALLRDDVVTTMPPSPTWIAGSADHRIFYAQMFQATGPDALRLVPLGANRELAFGFYRAATAGAPHLLRAIEVVTVQSGRVARIDHFMGTSTLVAFGLPSTIVPSPPHT